MEIVAGIVIYIGVKFGDHRRWSETAARGVPTLGGAWRRVRRPWVMLFGLLAFVLHYEHVGILFS